MIPATPFTCEVIHVHDGDGPLWCASGQKVRIAGVQSPDYEDAEPCRQHRAGYSCDDTAADRARVITTRIVLHQRLTCQPLGRSYQRIVAACVLPSGERLECAVLRAGAGVVWGRYWRGYGMEACHG